VGALAQALEQLAADPSQRQRLGGTARDQLLSRDWSQLAPVWDGVLGGT
ncbi:MAG: glycosyltransferase family 4 protein, partial [Synechococcus sp. BS307-5m-G35]|nr:glycosyltransferase family 4 protein [Synechococcus sp. BS307-5m-G35]